MEKVKQLKVKYVNKGIANFFGNYVEINIALKGNKKLRDYIIKHELGHSEKFDLLHEFKIDWKIIPSLIWFILKHPSTWRDFSPIQFRDKKIIYDLNLSILYAILISLIILAILFFKLIY